MVKREMSEQQKKNLQKGKPISAEVAREYQKKSAVSRKKNNEEAKLNETFCISSNKALAPIQASSLKELARKADEILHEPEPTSNEIKLAMEILIFLRDSSGQKPVDKQEIKTNQPAVLSEYSEKKIEEVLQRIKNCTYE